MTLFIFFLGCYFVIPAMVLLNNKKEKLIACLLFTAWSYTYIMSDRIKFHSELEALYIKVDETIYLNANKK